MRGDDASTSRPLTRRNVASIPNDTAIMTPSTDAAPMLLLAISATSALVQATAATIEIHAFDPRSLEVRASAELTTAKMMRNPALPIVASPARCGCSLRVGSDGTTLSSSDEAVNRGTIARIAHGTSFVVTTRGHR